MIRRELFNEKMRAAFLFVGQKVTNEAAEVIYDEIKQGYTEKDFLNMIEDLKAAEVLRITGPVIVKRLNHYRSERIEREAEEDRKKHEQDAINFWNRQYDGSCDNHKCYSCDRVRCDDMARATIAYIKEILSFEPDITLSTTEQREQKRVYREARKELLIKNFPGAGFEKSYPRQDWITLDELQGRKPKTMKQIEQPKQRADIDPDFPEERP